MLPQLDFVKPQKMSSGGIKPMLYDVKKHIQMPIKEENKKRYPKNWKQISERIRFERANNKCEECGCENYQPHPITGSKVILTVAHLDHQPENCEDDNLKAMCQKCHNNYDRQHRNQTIRQSRLKNQMSIF